MKRTTIYLEPQLEVLLKLEVRRQQRPMAEIVREAVLAYVTREPQKAPPGAGAFSSGRSDTAERVDEVLAHTGFGLGDTRVGNVSRSARSRRKKTR
ncbi:MAG TPA: CopG family transcriptional regulator [Vicinamibacterales bacterium]|jgi:hypothetical protein